MDFAIYCYGTGEILWKTFNAIALIFGKSNFIDSSIAISASIGALWAMTRAVWGENIGIFARTWFLPTFLLFNVAFLPKTTVHIIDGVDHTWRYSAVDNVPLGVAFIPSVASHFSKLLTEHVNRYMNPGDPESGYTDSGDMFGAKFIKIATDMRISNPRIRGNVKRFLNRCFLWPRIYANSEGLKDEAIKTDDILGFIQAHPHHWVGSYWENADGTREFIKSEEGVRRVRDVMRLIVPKKGKALTSMFFNWNEKQDAEGVLLQSKLKSMIASSWEAITGKGQDAFSVIEQYIMINSYREGLDDDREASRLPRLFPHFVSLQSSRIQAQQNLSSLISGSVAGSYIPMVQGWFFVVLIGLFIFVIPMSFMPGGLSIFVTWVRLVFWVSIWPVFFTMFECFAMMFLIKAKRAGLIESEGVSIMTQYGLAEIAFDYYAYFKGSLLLVPPISWFVISGSSYAITQFSGSIGAAISSSAAGAANEAVTGNVSYGNQSFNNRTSGSVSVGQQTLGPHVSFGRTVDSGAVSQTFDPVLGETHFEERMSHMKVESLSSDAYGAASNKEMSEATAMAEENRRGFEESHARQLDHGMSVADNIAHQKSAVRGFSDQENREWSSQVEQVMNAGGRHSGEHSLSNDSNSKNSISAHGGLSTGGILKKIGLDVGVKAEHETSVSASNSDRNSLTEEFGWNDQQLDLWRRGQTALKTGNVDWRDESSRQTSEEHRSSLNESAQKSEAYHASLNYSKNLSTSNAMSERGEFTTTTNRNDEILESVANRKFGGNKSRAFEWSRTHGDEYRAEVNQHNSSLRKAYMADFSGKIMTESELRTAYEGASRKVGGLSEGKFTHDGAVKWSVDNQRVSSQAAIGGEEMRLKAHYAVRGEEYGAKQYEVGRGMNDQGMALKGQYDGEKGRMVAGRAASNTFGVKSSLGDIGSSHLKMR